TPTPGTPTPTPGTPTPTPATPTPTPATPTPTPATPTPTPATPTPTPITPTPTPGGHGVSFVGGQIDCNPAGFFFNCGGTLTVDVSVKINSGTVTVLTGPSLAAGSV